MKTIVSLRNVYVPYYKVIFYQNDEIRCEVKIELWSSFSTNLASGYEENGLNVNLPKFNGPKGGKTC